MSTLAVKERFWAKADASGGPDSCWSWQGAQASNGYGVFVPEHKAVLAHRFALGLSGTDFTPDDCVLHHCDTPLCVNPAHLWVGDRAANNADRDAKGRTARGTGQHGEANPSAKLTEQQVLAIRETFKTGVTLTQIARQFGIAKSTCGDIVARRRWAHV